MTLAGPWGASSPGLAVPMPDDRYAVRLEGNYPKTYITVLEHSAGNSTSGNVVIHAYYSEGASSVGVGRLALKINGRYITNTGGSSYVPHGVSTWPWNHTEGINGLQLEANETANTHASFPIPGTAIAYSGGTPYGVKVLHFELAADLNTNTSDNVSASVKVNGTDFGTATAAVNEGWKPFAKDITSAYAAQTDVVFTYTAGVDTAHFRRVRIDLGGSSDYGQYPKGVDYTSADQDGYPSGTINGMGHTGSNSANQLRAGTQSYDVFASRTPLTWYFGYQSWTIEFELATQDNAGARDVSEWELIANGTSLGRFRSPEPANNTATNPDDPALWRLHRVPWGNFNPSTDNHLELGYVAGGDYGYIRALRVYGGNGVVYYGEYPKGTPYGSAVYEASRTQTGLRDTYNPGGTRAAWLCGDGAYPPFQWDHAVKDYVEYPVGPNGNSTGKAHIYFTIAAPDLTLCCTDVTATGQDQYYTVPSGVEVVEFDLYGGAGGDYKTDAPTAGKGGLGARQRVRLAVTPGETLKLVVGKKGPAGNEQGQNSQTYGGGGRGQDSGFNGTYGAAGAGGGASSIWRGTTLLAIAGGGGGGAGPDDGTTYERGGHGGRGGDGVTLLTTSASDGENALQGLSKGGLHGGTSSAPRGTGGTGPGGNGKNGSYLLGGDSGGPSDAVWCGGGGGGGLYGGGGGGAGGAVDGGGGGGGGSCGAPFAEVLLVEPGVRAGDGLISICIPCNMRIPSLRMTQRDDGFSFAGSQPRLKHASTSQQANPARLSARNTYF